MLAPTNFNLLAILVVGSLFWRSFHYNKNYSSIAVVYVTITDIPQSIGEGNTFTVCASKDIESIRDVTISFNIFGM